MAIYNHLSTVYQRYIININYSSILPLFINFLEWAYPTFCPYWLPISNEIQSWQQNNQKLRDAARIHIPLPENFMYKYVLNTKCVTFYKYSLCPLTLTGTLKQPPLYLTQWKNSLVLNTLSSSKPAAKQTLSHLSGGKTGVKSSPYQAYIKASIIFTRLPNFTLDILFPKPKCNFSCLLPKPTCKFFCCCSFFSTQKKSLNTILVSPQTKKMTKEILCQ